MFFMKKKITQGLIWNYMSLVILAISGILINIIIASFYGSSTLGIFNQVYAIYIMASQFAVGGIHFSTLKHIAENSQYTNKHNKIFFSALFLAGLFGFVIFLVIHFSANMLGNILQSKEVAHGLVLAAPALLVFSINKVMLAALNGLHRMRIFAIGQGLRYLLMVLFVLALVIIDLTDYWLTGAFLFSELVLFLFLGPIILHQFKFTITTINKEWINQHFTFGIKGFFSGVFIEINSRVDVLMLGIFTTDKVVGIYSFAAMLAEGFYHLFVVVRNNLNPILVQLIAQKRINELHALVRKTQRIMYPAMLGIALFILITFLPALAFLPTGTEFTDSFPVLAILIGGFWLISGYVPFDMILTQAGFPEFQTLFNAVGVAINIVLNAILIPIFGSLGAASATATSFILMIISLNIMVHHKLGYSLR
jgi:O-antigen/teichoic acid export membrane protein